MQRGVLRTYRGIVQAGGDGVGQRNLPGIVLQYVGIGTLQHAGAATTEACGVVAQPEASSTGFDANEPDMGLVYEIVECANRIGTAAYAGQHCGG